MKATDEFKRIIKEHLDNRAAEDELFAVSYSKEGKSIEVNNKIIETIYQYLADRKGIWNERVRR